MRPLLALRLAAAGLPVANYALCLHEAALRGQTATFRENISVTVADWLLVPFLFHAVALIDFTRWKAVYGRLAIYGAASVGYHELWGAWRRDNLFFSDARLTGAGVTHVVFCAVVIAFAALALRVQRRGASRADAWGALLALAGFGIAANACHAFRFGRPAEHGIVALLACAWFLRTQLGRSLWGAVRTVAEPDDETGGDDDGGAPPRPALAEGMADAG